MQVHPIRPGIAKLHTEKNTYLQFLLDSGQHFHGFGVGIERVCLTTGAGLILRSCVRKDVEQQDTSTQQTNYNAASEGHRFAGSNSSVSPSPQQIEMV